MPVSPSIDIFCRVIDNYGDIGVCWRLARQLSEKAGPVRLWVDDLLSFARIAPGVDPQASVQTLDHIIVFRWDEAAENPAQPHAPADLVIEAFACSPPETYITRMSPGQVWINLEYLSAEDWVESCHGLPSMQANGLRKFFFFPGFTSRTGGLLREAGLLEARDAWQSSPNARMELLSGLGIEQEWLERLRAGAMLVYVYCYPQAPLPALIDALSQQGRDTLILMAQGIWPSALPDSVSGGCTVGVRTHEFVDQATFDRLLWSSDLNIVRGEDSLIRAIWAARPMIWQPYLQEDDAHMDKLTAWLARSPYPVDVHQLLTAWNRVEAGTLIEALDRLLKPEVFSHWETVAQDWSERLALEPDLATRLVMFHADHSQTR